jgi:DUF4097 and DUF4098 domain-containing protein YvlB
MIHILASVLLAGMSMSSQLDTTVTVRPGVRLEINNFGGDISVATWSRNAVRIEAEQSGRARTLVESRDGALTVRSVGRIGPPGSIDYRITAPRWMDLKLTGVYTDVTVENTQAAVSAETVRGDVRLIGGRGFIHLSSIQGTVAVEKASGRLEVSSVNEAVSLRDVSGEITAETVNGDIDLQGIASGAVEGATVNGDITYDGAIRNGGRYHFATHNGDVIVVLPRQSNVTVAVSTFSGDFESSFPVRITESRRGKRFNFTLGSGGADLELESFQGGIRLQRPEDRPRAKKVE